MEAGADGWELEEQEEAVLEPRDVVGVQPVAAAATGGGGSVSLSPSIGSSVVWLVGWDLGSALCCGPAIREAWGSKFEAAWRRNCMCICEQRSTRGVGAAIPLFSWQAGPVGQIWTTGTE